VAPLLKKLLAGAWASGLLVILFVVVAGVPSLGSRAPTDEPPRPVATPKATSGGLYGLMSRAQVLAVLGPPTAVFRKNRNAECWSYLRAGGETRLCLGKRRRLAWWSFSGRAVVRDCFFRVVQDARDGALSGKYEPSCLREALEGGVGKTARTRNIHRVIRAELLRLARIARAGRAASD
jgi:hypothetical protein